MSTNFFDRDFYRCSGKTDWGRFIWHQTGMILKAAVGAVLMFFVTRYIFNLLIVMPVLAGGGLGALGQSVVSKSHCRNRWLAAVGGLAAGCVLFFGTYYVELVWMFGWRGWTRFDLLPGIIKWHVENNCLAFNGVKRDPDAGVNAVLLATQSVLSDVPLSNAG